MFHHLPTPQLAAWQNIISRCYLSRSGLKCVVSTSHIVEVLCSANRIQVPGMRIAISNSIRVEVRGITWSLLVVHSLQNANTIPFSAKVSYVSSHSQYSRDTTVWLKRQYIKPVFLKCLLRNLTWTCTMLMSFSWFSSILPIKTRLDKALPSIGM